MPLLKKTVFEKHTIKDYLRDDEEVFYCEITNEIFRDYEEFSERMFLYNSMVWTCCMTGKQNLTYQEALESEDNARQSLKEFPIELRLPILFLASKTHRTSLGDMTDDVFNFVKDRYFIGENLETSFTSNWKDSHVLQVIAPPADTIASQKNGNKTDSHFFPPANLFKYEIEHLDADDNDISEIMIVDCNQIRRRKGSFNRDKCKLFLRQYVEHDPRGIIIMKPSVIEELGINKIKFEQIFDGPLPNFEISKEKEKKPKAKKKLSQEKMSKYLTKTNGDITKKPVQNKNGENKVNLLEQMKKKEEEFKQQQQLKEEERSALKKKQKQETLLLNSSIKKWWQPKEDTELENQKKLPEYMPVKAKVPEKHFGEMLMVMEFIESFSKLLSTKDFFPAGVNLELMERALTEKEIAGPFTDIIQMFLTALFNAQDEESNQYRTYISKNSADIKEDDVTNNLSLTDATRLATMASKWSNNHQGLPLGRLPLYAVTVSEILRLHLLSSGARINDTGAKWRYAQRGGYTSEDDPGLHLRLDQPQILKALATHNVVELSLNEKLKILDCLMNQLLTYADVRDVVEERLDKNRQQKLDLKAIQLVEKKREQEYITAKQKLLKELKGEPEKLKESLDKLEKDGDRRQYENNKKINKLLNAIHDGQTIMGTDRAYRKYLKLDSVPAIFINDEEEHPGMCDDSICGQNPDLVDASRPQLLKYMRKMYIDSTSKSPSKRRVNGSMDLSFSLIVDEDKAKELLMCTTDPKTCPIHSTNIERVKWSFIHHEFQLQELEDSLNKRGIREGELLQAIQNYKERLDNIVSQTPGNLLNPIIETKELADDQKSTTRNNKKLKDRYEDSNLGYPPTMSSEEILENVLLDNILEMEEKIFGGGLGNLLVKNREEWRQCLSSKKYDDLDTTITKREKKLQKARKSDKGNSRPTTPEIPAPKPELKDYQDPGRFLGASIDVENDRTNGETNNSTNCSEHIKKSVTVLAIALAQVARAVDPKYMKKPLGSGDVGKSDKKSICDVLDKWEQSLLSSTSYSQVFLHHGTLDSCIMWSRSALLARCRICRRQKDSENMLLCDKCNLGHHLYCLKPKLTSIPQGDWFCDRCMKEKEKEEKLLSPEPTKKRKIFRDEDMEEEEESVDDNNEEEDESQDDEESSGSEDEGTNGYIKFELCKTCGSGGELISCEKCSSTYHIECCEPPLRRAPRGSWNCHNCKSKHQLRERSDSESSDEISLSIRRNRREDTRNDLPLHNAALQELLLEVMKHQDAWAFVRPVQKTEVKDYYDIITKPMDFGTIKYKLNMGEYSNDSQLMEDAALVFENCNTYNDTEAEVYKCGVRLLKFFEKKAKELGLKIPEEMTSDDTIPPKKKRRSK